MAIEATTVIKTRKGILALLGIQKRKKEIFRIADNMLFYNSRLGKIGVIESEWIDFIEPHNFSGAQAIKIGIKNEFKTQFKYKMNKFNQKMSEIFVEESGAEIIILPNEMSLPTPEFLALLKNRLNK